MTAKNSKSGNLIAHDLDRLDQRILEGLARDARISNLALAQQVGLSPAACLRRVKNLEDRGVLSGTTTLIHRKALGLNVEAFVQISLERQTPDYVDRLHEAIRHLPEVRACYLMTGSVDYLLHIVTTDLDAYAEIVSRNLLALPGVKDVRSSFVLRCEKREPGVYVV
jgi:Lrp/AsnC family leucine-responsive transcriptional regulator